MSDFSLCKTIQLIHVILTPSRNPILLLPRRVLKQVKMQKNERELNENLSTKQNV